MGAPDLQDRPADLPAKDGSRGGGRPDLRIVLPLLVILAIAGGTALLIAGTGGGSERLPGGGHGVRSASFAGQEFSQQQPEPPLALRNYLGEPIDIAAYRGGRCCVTFLYTHCPDVCPLITSDLRVAQNLMGPKVSAKAQIVAVSVDPRGDTPQTVAAFLKVHEMTGRMKYLIGSPRRTGARVGGVGRRLRTRRAAAPARQPLGAGLRDHGERQADDDLRVELQAERNRARRAAAGVAVVRGARRGGR